MTYKEKYIGEKQIKKVTKDNTHFLITYMDDTTETISYLLLDKIVSDEPCNVTQLRDKRVEPIVEEVLKVLKNWGLKLNELSPLSNLLNQSIDFNQTQATLELWRPYVGTLKSPEDIDMITLDKILKQIKIEDRNDDPSKNQTA